MTAAVAEAPAGVAAAPAKDGPVWAAKVLLLALAMPFFFPVGPMFLTADRIVLLLAFIPCLKIWLSGGAGRLLLADWAMLFYCLWMALSTFLQDGASIAVEAAGINMLETFGAYLVGRCMIRTPDAFLSMSRFLFLMVALMLPFGILETLTGENLLLETANKIWPSYADVPKEPRWGLDRVSGLFYHPILFGVFCGASFGLTFYVLGYGVSAFKRLFMTTLVGVTTFLSLSSGPITALVAQLCIVLWDRLLVSFRQRWIVLISGVGLLWSALAVAANRSVPEIFLTYFAFNPSTAYNRLRIWEYGTITVQQNPILGVGMTGDWFRPSWMSGSMDMFWLVPAVKFGLPAGIAIHLGFLGIFVAVAMKSGLSERAKSYRMGLLVTLLGFYLAGWTVHYWKVIYVFFMFLIGSGAWLLGDSAQDGSEASERVTEDPGRAAPAYSRVLSARQPRGAATVGRRSSVEGPRQAPAKPVDPPRRRESPRYSRFPAGGGSAPRG